MITIQEELERVRELLLLEKEEDFEQFRRLVQSLPLAQRQQKGLTWYPVDIIKKGYTYGDRAYVTVYREGADQLEHQFRAGKTVRLFTLQPDVRNADRNGVIHYIDKNKMKIILGAQDLPHWLGLGMIGVDLMFDETTYLEMEKAMQKVIGAKQGRLAELRRILLGEQAPRYRPVKKPVQLPELNPSQNHAVNEILAAQDVAVIHGPPGTGKTTTLVQAVKVLSEREANILVTAPSNTAVDLLTERLAEVGLSVVRIGNISRIDEHIIRHTLEMQLAQHPESKSIKRIKQEAAEARRRAARLYRKRGKEAYDERRKLRWEANELSAWANTLENRLIDQILDAAQVITCTLVGANQKMLEKRAFQTVFIDEAAQALEPASWIPITKASKVVLTGDPFQLPPTVKSREAQKGGFSVTLIEKCIQRMDRVSLLNVQYRMHRDIMNFSNQQFYNNALEAAPAVREHRLAIEQNQPVWFIDTAGCGFEEKLEPNYQSRYNPEEFLILTEHLYQLINAYPADNLPSIGIISPYREQVQYMTETIQDDPVLAGLPLTVKTIDGFQGQERDVIYISLVRSNRKGEIGFLNDYRRMNVAMTRARKQLVIVGDSATIGGSPFYQAFLAYCERSGEYQTAWAYMK